MRGPTRRPRLQHTPQTPRCAPASRTALSCLGRAVRRLPSAVSGCGVLLAAIPPLLGCCRFKTVFSIFYHLVVPPRLAGSP
jgi:hypothetical protein